MTPPQMHRKNASLQLIAATQSLISCQTTPMMSFKQVLLIGAAIAVGVADGFAPVARRHGRTMVVCQEKHILDDIEEMCMENVARFCLEQECPVGETAALLTTFKLQRELLLQRVADLDDLVAKLEASEAVEIKDLDDSHQNEVRSWFGAKQKVSP
jgi:hypothetical protein